MASNLIIKPVNTSSQFILNYVKINNIVYSKDFALNYFTKSTIEIFKALNEPKKHLSLVKKYVYPKLPEMVEQINVIANLVYKQLNIKKPKNQLQEFEAVAKIYDYLVKNVNYNMLTVEERGSCFEDNMYYINGLIKNNVDLENHKLKPALSDAFKLKHKQKTKELYKVRAQNNEELQKNTPLKSSAHIKSLYNTLIRGEGVCQDFTNTFNFLLGPTGINTYKIIVNQSKDNLSVHTFNLVEFINKNKKAYYALDITKGLFASRVLKSKNLPTDLVLFGLGKKEAFTKNCKVLSIQKYNKQGLNTYTPQVEDVIVAKELPSSLIDYLKVKIKKDSSQVNIKQKEHYGL